MFRKVMFIFFVLTLCGCYPVTDEQTPPVATEVTEVSVEPTVVPEVTTIPESNAPFITDASVEGSALVIHGEGFHEDSRVWLFKYGELPTDFVSEAELHASLVDAKIADNETRTVIVIGYSHDVSAQFVFQVDLPEQVTAEATTVVTETVVITDTQETVVISPTVDFTEKVTQPISPAHVFFGTINRTTPGRCESFSVIQTLWWFYSGTQVKITNRGVRGDASAYIRVEEINNPSHYGWVLRSAIDTDEGFVFESLQEDAGLYGCYLLNDEHLAREAPGRIYVTTRGDLGRVPFMCTTDENSAIRLYLEEQHVLVEGTAGEWLYGSVLIDGQVVYGWINSQYVVQRGIELQVPELAPDAQPNYCGS